MRVYFDDKSFKEDLNQVVFALDRWDKPIVVVPTEKDVREAVDTYKDNDNYKHVTFISYEYFISKKWVVDDNYDHIDFFRINQWLAFRSFGINVGCATVTKTNGKHRKKKGEKNDNE